MKNCRFVVTNVFLILTLFQTTGCLKVQENSQTTSEGAIEKNEESKPAENQIPNLSQPNKEEEEAIDPLHAVMSERILKTKFGTDEANFLFKKATFTAEGLKVVIVSKVDELINLKWKTDNKIIINTIEVGLMDDYIGEIVLRIKKDKYLSSKISVEIVPVSDINLQQAKFEYGRD